MDLQVQILNASSSNEIHAAFATIARERPDALFLGSDPLWTNRRVQLATLAMRHAIPMACQAREVVEAGGLMSYGANVEHAFRQAGVYAVAMPADLPIVQATKFELVINAETARMLGVVMKRKTPVSEPYTSSTGGSTQHLMLAVPPMHSVQRRYSSSSCQARAPSPYAQYDASSAACTDVFHSSKKGAGTIGITTRTPAACGSSRPTAPIVSSVVRGRRATGAS